MSQEVQSRGEERKPSTEKSRRSWKKMAGEMERGREKSGKERFFLLAISKITFVQLYMNNSFLCVCISDKRIRK